MLRDGFSVHAFQPVRLTVDRVGPFQDAPISFDFTDDENKPCNFFLLMSKNGRGKTTLLELITLLVGMLAKEEMEAFGHEDLDLGRGRAQLDVRLQIYREGIEKAIVLSLVAGAVAETPLRVWIEKDLEEVEAASWHVHGFRRRPSGVLERMGKTDVLVEDLVKSTKLYTGVPPTGFENETLLSPTLLYFSAYRDITHIHEKRRGIEQPLEWGYRPVHRFAQEGGNWTESLDNLLVWMKWLDDGRFERAVELINSRVFKAETKFLKDIRRVPPEAIVVNDGNEHRLDRLSSGEKSLIQLFLRIGAHMTYNTLLLIDEMEVHLHPNMQHRLLNLLKQLAKDNPGMTIIASTHSREILMAFAFEIREAGLRKGGHLIEADFDVRS
jgi:predicted ATPase